jgi:ketosteroid isomerase-like protein
VEHAAATALTVFRKQADGSWKVVEDFEVRAARPMRTTK